jgi:phage shock protein A
MGIFSQIVTAIRGGATEVGEAIVDSQSLRILDQEIRDAGAELVRSKDALANLMAQKKLAGGKVEALRHQIAEYEGYALQALNKGDEALAMDIANKIADFEQQAAAEQELADGYAAAEAKTKQSIQQADSNLRRLKQQVDTVKATESAQKAQATIAARHSGASSAMGTAMASLERIKERQQVQAARFEAAEELAGGPEEDLQRRLQAAGIAGGSGGGQSVLARLQSRQMKALPGA